MFRFFPYILKSLWGHRTRTLSTVSGAAVALFVFYLCGGRRRWSRPVDQRRGGRPHVDRLPSQPLLPIHQLAAAGLRSRRSPRSKALRDVIPIKVYTNNCRASLDVIVFHGVPAREAADGAATERWQGSLRGLRAAARWGARGPGRSRRRGICHRRPLQHRRRDRDGGWHLHRAACRRRRTSFIPSLSSCSGSAAGTRSAG